MSARRGWVLVAVAGAVVVGAATLPWGAWAAAWTSAARGAGWLGVALFFAAYVVSATGLFPGSALTLAVGFTYGPLWGVAVASPASVLGATVAFVLGRTLFRDWVSRRLAGLPRVQAVDRAIGQAGFRLVLLLRLSPLFPFSVLNYVFSLSRVGLGTYVVASFIGMLPGTVMYVYIGSIVPAAAELTTDAGASGRGLRLFFYIAGLAATVAAAVLTARLAQRALAGDTQGASEHASPR